MSQNKHNQTGGATLVLVIILIVALIALVAVNAWHQEHGVTPVSSTKKSSSQ